jgi:predicted AlkP superfamily pyrophosphatase or phosphodiesterase
MVIRIPRLSNIRSLILYIVLWSIIGCGGESSSTVLLISLDGFRWDYFEKTDTPNLDRLAQTGVKARGLIPVFPTKTYPNHYSIITGLYPENSGVVGNIMFDPIMGDTFSVYERESVSDGRWYGGEPLWVTAEKQGVTAATLFWAGSEAEINGLRPSYWYPYDHDLPHADRIQQALAWFDLPQEHRPRLICMYFPDIDDGGHIGTNSPELMEAIQRVDSSLGVFFEGLIQRGMMEEVNFVVLSDHGMAEIDSTQVIFLDDYIDIDKAGVINWTPVLGLRPPEIELDNIYSALKGAHPRMQVYQREEMPSHLFYSKHHRIPLIIGIADEGWSISTRANYAQNPGLFNGGAHGYDWSYPSMRGIFIARGPAFNHGQTIDHFQNIHIYPLLAKILDIKPAPHDGSLDSVKVMLK